MGSGWCWRKAGGCPSSPTICFMRAGAGEDPAGKSGTAHFLEHMMFKGSRTLAPGAFSRAVAREGGQDNAFTSRDVTAYHQTVEASRLPLVMRMEADRFAFPLLPGSDGGPGARRGAGGARPAHRQQPARPLLGGLRGGDVGRRSIGAAGRSSAGRTRYGPSPAPTCGAFTPAAMRPPTPCWWSPAMHGRRGEALAEELYGGVPARAATRGTAPRRRPSARPASSSTIRRCGRRVSCAPPWPPA